MRNQKYRRTRPLISNAIYSAIKLQKRPVVAMKCWNSFFVTSGRSRGCYQCGEGRQGGRQAAGGQMNGWHYSLHESTKHVMITTARKYGVLQFFIYFPYSLHIFTPGLFIICQKLNHRTCSIRGKAGLTLKPFGTRVLHLNFSTLCM
jgi:hypothetical protein